MLPIAVIALVGVAAAQIRLADYAQTFLGFFQPAGLDAFEPEDFDVVTALQEKGINISTIAALQDQPAGAGCSRACAALSAIYGEEVVVTSTAADYATTAHNFWSVHQAAVEPQCVFVPPTADAVAVAVLVNRLTACSFAAKSGGHAAFRGASSAPDGMTLSFAGLQAVDLSADKTRVTVGPGNVWGRVFDVLDDHDLTVVGGRVYDVGVGGLLTGGGISYFSNLYGFACDNVESFDVVTASGRIVSANTTSHPDLYWALRGGGNNFGLVVAFHLRTIPLPDHGAVYIGSRLCMEPTFDAIEAAFYELTVHDDKDPRADMFGVYSLLDGVPIAYPTFYYANASAGETAPVWDQFNAIPSVAGHVDVQNIVDFAKVVADQSPYGLRQCYYTMTIRADLETLTYGRRRFFETHGQIAGLAGLRTHFVFQAIGPSKLQHAQKNGGNALGLTPADGPLMILMLPTEWTDAADDDAIYAWVSALLADIKAFAVSRGTSHPFLYMNYASRFQDVISSYGPATRARLQEVSLKYDPAQVFQKLQPGYFKLGGSPPEANTGYFNY